MKETATEKSDLIPLSNLKMEPPTAASYIETVLRILKTRDWTERRKSIEWRLKEALKLASGTEAKDSSCH